MEIESARAKEKRKKEFNREVSFVLSSLEFELLFFREGWYQDWIGTHGHPRVC